MRRLVVSRGNPVPCGGFSPGQKQNRWPGPKRSLAAGDKTDATGAQRNALAADFDERGELEDRDQQVGACAARSRAARFGLTTEKSCCLNFLRTARRTSISASCGGRRLSGREGGWREYGDGALS